MFHIIFHLDRPDQDKKMQMFEALSISAGECHALGRVKAIVTRCSLPLSSSKPLKSKWIAISINGRLQSGSILAATRGGNLR